MKTKVIKISMLLIFIFCISCSTQDFLGKTKKHYPIIIYVKSNDKGFINPVNISVKMDSKIEIVNQSFYAGYENLYSTFEINLEEGRHQIIVNSSNGNDGLDVVFKVDKPLWLVLSYWGPNHFQLNISDSKVAFV